LDSGEKDGEATLRRLSRRTRDETVRHIKYFHDAWEAAAPESAMRRATWSEWATDLHIDGACASMSGATPHKG
jgi:hypothetical protein